MREAAGDMTDIVFVCPMKYAILNLNANHKNRVGNDILIKGMEGIEFQYRGKTNLHLIMIYIMAWHESEITVKSLLILEI